MKKTLISLAVAVSAAVSGSAMAMTWTADGTGGSIDLGGTLKPSGTSTPWEVKVGDEVSGLEVHLPADKDIAVLTLDKTIPILSIRTKSNTPFFGRAGIAPQVKIENISWDQSTGGGRAPFEREVIAMPGRNQMILTTEFFAQGRFSVKGNTASNSGQFWIYAANAGDGFWGGLPKTSGQVSTSDRVAELMPEAAENYNNQAVSAKTTAVPVSFALSDHTYSGYYYVVIESGTELRFRCNMDQFDAHPATEYKWNVNLPVTVSYV